MPFASSSCWRGPSLGVQRFDDGTLTMRRLPRRLLRAPGAEETYSEGIIDNLRAVAGTKVAAWSAS